MASCDSMQGTSRAGSGGFLQADAALSPPRCSHIVLRSHNVFSCYPCNVNLSFSLYLPICICIKYLSVYIYQVYQGVFASLLIAHSVRHLCSMSNLTCLPLERPLACLLSCCLQKQSWTRHGTCLHLAGVLGEG